MRLCEKNKCTGCAACFSVCPTGAITMREDSEGFLYPIIDEITCVECDSCTAICPLINENKNGENTNAPKTYAVKYADTQLLQRSSSGGAFAAFAECILNQGGIVYGASFDNDLNVRHICVNSMAEIEPIQGSKYIASEIGNAYRDVKQVLLSGRGVLFSGCPCQIAGLYAYLQKPYEGLYTADIVCHGVPSNKLWRTYLDYLRKRHRGSIISYSFRDKSKWGWGNWGSYVYSRGHKTKKHYFTVAADYYYSLYFKENCLRESCYSCKYASLPRQGDVTLGDYWGIDKACPGFDSKGGVSVVLSNNQKGDELISYIDGQNVIIQSEIAAAVANNQTIIRPTKRPPSRDSFYSDFDFINFEKSVKKHCRLRVFLPTIARHIPTGWKRRLKRFVHKK